uniref:ABC transporter n=1 Tax=Salvia miltiorrhiza TaxID=226208 RepID=A0A8E6YI63_SALMI|nr:ABC transporter [Salvia miltiorrhiza]
MAATATADDEALLWAAIERLPTYDRVGRSVMKHVLDDGTVKSTPLDLNNLAIEEWSHLRRTLLHALHHDHHDRFLRRQRTRADRVGIETPKIEIRYEHLAVEGDVHVGSRALPTLINATMNFIESVLGIMKLAPSKKRKIQILKDATGIIRPSRLALVLGPPGAGKTTFLLSLAGKLDHNLRKSGKITFCGHDLSEFVPQKTCAYISQHDLHHGEMTVRETLDFSARCLGVGSRYDLLAELSRREKEAGIKPDPEIDAIMKATSIPGQKTSLLTDYALKILGLDTCSDTLVGDGMRRGISGGEKKRLTTGEMLVGPTKAFLMDEISTGLDSSTTFQIVKYMRQIVHIMDVTMVISLLQPAPETYNLFDDVILLSEGHIVYQGPREAILDFFDHMGFKCPERKGEADFLQEVTSKKDQEQYWYKKDQHYRYISPSDFAEAFNSFHVGQRLSEELRVPYDKSRAHPAALVKEKYGIPPWELFRACFSREWLLMKRNSLIYIFKTVQITVMSLIALTVFFRTEMPYGRLTDGGKYFGALFFSLLNLMFNGVAELALTVIRLPVFFKQRDFYLYPAWAFCLPIWILRIPLSVMESTIWIVLTYYTIGFAPSATRFFGQFLTFFSINQMALGLFRFIAALGRTQVVAHTLGTFSLFVIFILGGFIVAKNDLDPWLRWTYYFSPLSYGQNAIVMNEFLDKRWSSPNTDPRFNGTTVGKVLLQSRGFFTEERWFWICCVALLAFSVLFNILFIVALTFLNLVVGPAHERGMILPFEPLSLVFDHIYYYVDIPAEMKAQGVKDDRLQLLRDVSGAFRPGVLTAIVGVSGAGKTTLMDVLAGRKTSGYIEGSINISGFPKNQATFARISGYCEQNDNHSPNVTVYESVLYSAWLRLPADVKKDTREMFVEEVMELVELNPIRNSIVGQPAVYGLSTEQRKRLTIAVELVANPSIIFMDEPTSGLDARAAAIVMRTVRNTVDTGRTVACTIHQPSIDIFEAFDELLLITRGGKVIYGGELGSQSHKMIEYFETIPGVPKIEDGYNPATWMLDISTPAAEHQIGVDFAEIYSKSSLYQSVVDELHLLRNQELIQELSSPPPGSKDLYFPTKYSQSFLEQCRACFWKHNQSYWRNPEYNAIRFVMTVLIGLVFGLIFWNKGQKIKKQQDLQNLLGAIYAAVLFLGSTNGITVLDVVCVERTVLYREMAAGMYSAFPYAFAQVAIETIYVAIQTIIYTLLLYSMIGFQWTISKFLLFYYFIFTSFIYFTLFGMMFIALTPGLQVGAIVSSFFHSLWNLFSGFLLSRMVSQRFTNAFIFKILSPQKNVHLTRKKMFLQQIPIWWRWYYWGSPVAWTIYGVVASQFGDLDSEIEVPGLTSLTVKTFIKQSLGFDHDFLPVVVFMHLVFILLFVFIFGFGIKYLNYQKR